MNLKRLVAFAAAAAVALSPFAAVAQNQPIPTAPSSATGRPVPATPTAITIAPAGGSFGKGTLLSFDHGMPIQGRDTGTGLPCTIGLLSTCQLPGSGGGGGGGGAVTAGAGAFVAGSYLTGAIVDLGALNAGAWSGSGDGSLISIDKAQYLKIEAVRALLAGTLTVQFGSTPTINIGTAPTLTVQFGSTPSFNCASGCSSASAGFAPDNGSLQPLSPTTSAGSPTALTLGSGAGPNVKVFNVGSQAFHYRLCPTSTCVSTTSDERIQPGNWEAPPRGSNLYISLITDSGSGGAEVTTGTGSLVGGIGQDLSQPSKITDGCPSASTEPSATGAGTRVDALCDPYGRRIANPALRVNLGKQHTAIGATSETTIITATAGVFEDPYLIWFDNSNATVANCTIKDATGGTTVKVVQIPANGSNGVSVDAGAAIPQAAVNNNWTATCSQTGIDVLAVFRKRAG